MFTLALTRNCLELCDIQLEGLDLANPLLLSEAFREANAKELFSGFRLKLRILSISINNFFLA
jgi:hypothetical protein